MQWEFMHCPRDFCWGVVREVWSILGGIPLDSRQPGSSRTQRKVSQHHHLVKINRGLGLSKPILPDCLFDIEHCGNRLSLTLESLVRRAQQHCGYIASQVLGVSLPHCLGELIRFGKWTDVGFCSRWGELAPGWPGAAWSRDRILVSRARSDSVVIRESFVICDL